VRSVVAGAAAAVALALVLYAVFDGPQLVNYDTLYGIVWGRELAAGRTPELHVPFAPTPHPLLDVAAMGLAPLIGPPPPEYGDAAQGVVVAVALLALGAVGVLVFALGIPDRGTGARSWSATDCSSSSRSARASSARWPRSPRPSAPASAGATATSRSSGRRPRSGRACTRRHTSWRAARRSAGRRRS